MAHRPPLMKEMRWLAIAALVYSLLCVVMLLWQPQNSIEPVSLKSRNLKSLQSDGQLVRDLKLNHMSSLLNSQMLSEQGIKLKWIGQRITRMSVSWEKAQRAMVMEKRYLFTNPKKILLVPGLLSEYSAYDFANNAFKGGYLGELVQWSDLISTLHMLGHHLVVLTSRTQLSNRVPLDEPVFDIVFTDYMGLFALRDSQHYALYKCRIRVLDSFGTEPIFNFRTRDFQTDESLSMFTNWNFEDTRQFWTLFPHTPDNSFLGFVVESPDPDTTQFEKKSQAVIYGKEAFYANGKQGFLNTIGEIVEIHSTFNGGPGNYVPPHVIDHGVLPQNELHQLLRESKLFIGVGFPYDGPGPFEALANGCAFIQPKFNPPHSGRNMAFLAGKPTSRELTSQIPYLEEFVGEPLVYTVDVNNSTAIKEVVYNVITRKDPQSFIPREYTQEGMMERVGTYIIHQNFCDGTNLAKGKRASASSAHAEHSASEAVDGHISPESCFWTAPDTSHWWMVDLGADLAISKIRITNTIEWILAKTWGSDVFLNPFAVTLTDSQGDQVASRKFTDPRIFYLWEDINLRARFVRIDSLEYESARYFVLCGVEVFGGDSVHPTWPDMTLMRLKKANPGQSCKNACFQQKMLCEPAYLPAINNHKVLKDMFNCTDTHTLEETLYVSFPPAIAVSDDSPLQVSKGTCVTNGNRILLSCAGHHDHFQRLCSCRNFIRGQVAIPPPL